MSRSERTRGGPPPGGAGAEPKPERLADRLAELGRGRVPEPKGRGIAMMVLAALVVLAVIVQVLTGWGPRSAVRERPPAAELPPRGPTEGDGDEPRLPLEEPSRRADPPREREAPAPPAPRDAAPPPPTLGRALSERLRATMDGVRQRVSRRLAESSVRTLVALLDAAQPDERDPLRAWVLHRLEEAAEEPFTRRAAFDGALALLEEDPRGLDRLLAAAMDEGLHDDDAAPAALVLLERGAADERGLTDALTGVVLQELRPLHIRVLAARLLVRRGGVPREVAGLAGDPRTPAALRDALAPR